MARARVLTEGPVRGSLIYLALPLLIGNILQQLYNTADAVIIGRWVNSAAFGAVGVAGTVMNLFIFVLSGACSGITVLFSQAYGAGDLGTFRRELYQSTLFGALFTLALGALATALLRPLLLVIQTPAELIGYAAEYLRIIFAGFLATYAYNLCASALRSAGDTAASLCFLAVSIAANVGLDLLFVAVFGMGIGGAAWASVISTAAACAFGLVCLCGRRSSFRLGMRCVPAADWRGIAAAGSPSALNNLFQTLRLLAVNSMLLAAGGSELVAAFTAVNCIFAFSLSVVDGVPQAASAMLGIYSGERDNDSAALLIRREWRTGALCCAAFAAVVILAADDIALAYGLSVPLRLAMVCLSAGMFPGLWCSILSGLYNVSGHVRWANAIIFSRVFLAAAASLYLALALGWSPWWFLVLSEAVTVLLWWAAAGIYHRRHPELTRFLLLDRSLEEEGRVINFSVEGDTEDICDASRRISEFCEENDMNVRQVMRISLAIEEIMTMIVQENNPGHVSFDVRVFSLQQEMGIRISYDGREYDPFGLHAKGDMQYLGVDLIANMMRSVVYQRTFGVNTLQLLL